MSEELSPLAICLGQIEGHCYALLARKIQIINAMVWEESVRRTSTHQAPGPAGAGLWQSANRTTNVGWLRRDGDDQKGTGSEHWRGRYAGFCNGPCGVNPS